MLRKEKLLLVFLMLCIYTLHAQEKNKFKLGLELGPAIGADLGLLVAIEPKFNITKNSAVGLRVGGADFLGRKIEVPVDSQYIVEDGFRLHEVLSLAATFDQYLGKANSRFQPFIGGGLSYYKLSGIGDITTQDNRSVNFASDIKIKGQIGLLLRGGFELGKFRLGVEYNFIPKSDLQIPNGEILGRFKDSYFGVSFGFTFGGGKWGN